MSLKDMINTYKKKLENIQKIIPIGVDHISMQIMAILRGDIQHAAPYVDQSSIFRKPILVDTSVSSQFIPYHNIPIPEKTIHELFQIALVYLYADMYDFFNLDSKNTDCYVNIMKLPNKNYYKAKIQDYYSSFKVFNLIIASYLNTNYKDKYNTTYITILHKIYKINLNTVHTRLKDDGFSNKLYLSDDIMEIVKLRYMANPNLNNINSIYDYLSFKCTNDKSATILSGIEIIDTYLFRGPAIDHIDHVGSELISTLNVISNRNLINTKIQEMFKEFVTVNNKYL